MTTNNLNDAVMAARQPRKGARTAGQLVEDMRGEFAKVLPRAMSLDKFLRDTLTELRQNPSLGRCTEASLLGSLMTASRLGLEVGGPLGEFYLTPRKVKIPNTDEHEWAVVPIIGYKGLTKLARNTGMVGAIGVELIREGDQFEMGYDTQRGGHYIIHRPLDYVGAGRPITGTLAWARLAGGDRQEVFMPIEEIHERRDRGSARGTGPWKTDYEAMVRKTAIRRLCKDLPQSTELAIAQRVDEQIQKMDKNMIRDLGEQREQEQAEARQLQQQQQRPPYDNGGGQRPGPVTVTHTGEPEYIYPNPTAEEPGGSSGGQEPPWDETR